MGPCVVVPTAYREYAEDLLRAPKARCHLVHRAIPTDRDDKFVVFVDQTLSDVHGMTRTLGVTEVDIEARLLQSWLELVPLTHRQAVAGVGVEYAGYARHAPRERPFDFNPAEARNHE